ncbi:MAG: hypothetical protein JWM85_332 [Acidimicrobiaceae bacterium]|nr:hypothetical protein [Acidimicrobiaceae bacterium]
MSASSLKLGVGADGPWENREALIRARHPNPAAVGGWLNDTYSVQLFRRPTHPGIDHLCVRRHDEGTEIPWPHMQRIKDRLAVDGPDRWGLEVFPPALAVVDNCNLRHIWVMPIGWEPPVDLRDVKV